MRPTAKKLILGLLLAREGEPLSASEAIAACGLFDLSENNVRVTLARLRAEGLVDSPDRGMYCFGPAARGLAEQVFTWHHAEQRLRPWEGGFVAASVAARGRSDRKAMATRERALRLLGMRELERGFFIRPDNLQGGVEGVRERLRVLGLEVQAPVFAAAGFDTDLQKAIPQLWDVAALNRRYTYYRRKLENWLTDRHRLDGASAARESYLVGGQAIRHLVYDPWLPEAWIDAAARHAYVQTVQRFDAAGKQIWHALRGFDAGMPVNAAAQLSPEYAF